MHFWTDILKEGDGDEKAHEIVLSVSFVRPHPGTVDIKPRGDLLYKNDCASYTPLAYELWSAIAYGAKM